MPNVELLEPSHLRTTTCQAPKSTTPYSPEADYTDLHAQFQSSRTVRIFIDQAPAACFHVRVVEVKHKQTQICKRKRNIYQVAITDNLGKTQELATRE